jgi:hypothetical protein
MAIDASPSARLSELDAAPREHALCMSATDTAAVRAIDLLRIRNLN